MLLYHNILGITVIYYNNIIICLGIYIIVLEDLFRSINWLRTIRRGLQKCNKNVRNYLNNLNLDVLLCIYCRLYLEGVPIKYVL